MATQVPDVLTTRTAHPLRADESRVMRGFQQQPATALRPVAVAERTPWLVSLAAFLYAVSMHKYAVRNGLSSDTGIQGIVEMVGMLGAFFCALVATYHRKERYGFSLAYACFATLGVFALCSSWRSFYLPLSLVKGVIFLAVITTGYLLNQSGLGRHFFQSLYRWYFVSLLAGIVVGVLIPGKYPLFVLDEYSGRTDMQVLDTFFLVLGEEAALFLLLAPVIGRRVSILSQVCIFAINILAGGKVSTALLCTLLLLRYVTGVRRWRSYHHHASLRQ